MNKDIALKALDMAKTAGAQQARVTYTHSCLNQYTLLDGELEKLQHSLGSSLFIQLYSNGKYGAFSTNRMEGNELQKFIEDALLSIDYLTPDPCRGLPNPELYFKGECMDLHQDDPTYSEISPESKKELLLEVAQEADRSDSRIISVSNDYEDFKEVIYIADSQGFEGLTSQTLFSLSAECSVKGKGGARPQNWWFDSSMFYKTLPKGCCKEAVERTLAMIGAKKIKSGKYNIIIDRSVASKVVSPIFSALSGGSIQQRNSFLLDKLGKNVLGEKLTIKDTPHAPGFMGSRWFDSEGIATKEMEIVSEGVPQLYFLNSYFANKLNTTPTIESVSVPTINPFGASDAASMMKEMGSGILITGFNGGNCNGASGDFSFGIEGYLFKDGVILHPIKEMNMTGNILYLWKNVTNIGTDYRKCSRWLIPSIAFENVDLSGK